jgi:hypothetical protein
VAAEAEILEADGREVPLSNPQKVFCRVPAAPSHVGRRPHHLWPGRATDVDHPDELRVDLDPTLGVPIQTS